MTNMRKELLYIGMVISVLLLAVNAYAQSVPSGISADISADKQAILIGEPIRVTLTVRAAQHPLTFANIPDSLAHFEVISRSKIDTVIDKGLAQLQQVITLTSFDSGRWVIPSFDLPGTNIVTDSLTIDVGYMPMKPQDPIRDIKDIIPVSVAIPWWIIILSAALLIVLVVLFIRTLRSKAVTGSRFASRTNILPYEEAIQALDALSLPVASADIKGFYVSLDNILKRYLTRAFGWKASQFTTTDILLHLPDLMTSAEERSELAEVLRLGDAVKFARYFPEKVWYDKARTQIRKSIDSLHKIEKTS